MDDERASVRAAVEEIFRQVLFAVDAERLTQLALWLDGRYVVVAGQRVTVPGRVVLLAVGKASLPMARGALASLGERIERGLVVTKRGSAGQVGLPERIAVLEAAHPVPDESSLAAGRALLDLAESLGPGDLALVLISGGGSSLVEVPRAGVTLDDIARTTELLLREGADINRLNAVRSRLSLLKAGGLARAVAPARLANLIVSDVLGNPLPVIASGLSVDPGMSDDRLIRELRASSLWAELPAAVRRTLETTTRETRPRNVLLSEVLADAATAASAAARAAEEEGYTAVPLSTRFEGEAREFGRFWAQLASGVDAGGLDVQSPICLIGAGEMTVTVRGHGRGGRNTEMALAAALELSGEYGVAVASLATDGDDGNSGAAGGLVDGDSLREAGRHGLDPRALLADNDSARFLAACGGLIETGPTGTNVNDLYLALIQGGGGFS